MNIQLLLAAMSAALMMTSNTFPILDSAPSEACETVTSGDLIPGEAPMFDAHIEYGGQGYVVQGCFTEFLPGTSLVRPLYSLDGETWQICRTTWNLQLLGSESADDLKMLQNQICLYSSYEPLAGYLAGQLDRFYLKLQITLKNGITYETQEAVIDRGGPQPLPEEFTPVADFAPAIRIRQWRPLKRHGQYQITVSADATPEDISSLLPDTLPINIGLYEGIRFVTDATVDCPVTWNSLSLPRLTPGESITVEDAAEEIIIPAGTLLNTPNGIFWLNEPLNIEHDEIKLILNVVGENAEPTGALACEIGGLQITFHLKPTGATAIRAYTLSEGQSDWVELPDPLLPEEVNAPSSAANSTYTFLLKNTAEPYQSYLAAWNAGEEPVPFLIGIKIEGGIYDGRQLILAWPDSYELPASPPALNGSGGNECNAGSDNKNDSTQEGQRPDLPKEPETAPNVPNPKPPQDPKDKQESQGQEPQQLPEYPAEAQPSAPHISEARPEIRSNASQASMKQQTQTQQAQQPQQLYLPEDVPDELMTGQEADQDHSSAQLSAPDTTPVLTAGTTDLTPAPKSGAETTVAATITAGICIALAGGKAMTGGISVEIFKKIAHALHRILHL